MTQKTVAIIGAGISGLSLAYRLKQLGGPSLNIRLIEASADPGGKIHTEERDGFRLEWGPNGFLDNRPSTLQLVDDLGLRGELVASNEAAKRRYLWGPTGLVQFPESPVSFVTSPIMSTAGKLRMLGEPFMPGPPAQGPESLASFTRRRLGSEALKSLLGPMVSGIYAGDPEQLEFAAAFPKLADLEEHSGSLVRGMLEKVILKKGSQATQSEQPSSPTEAKGFGRLTSFRRGVGTLTQSLASALTGILVTSCSVQSLHQQDQGWLLKLNHLGREEDLFADVVVLATPAKSSARLLGTAENSVAHEMARLLSEIGTIPVTVLGLGFAKAKFPHKLDGFGFLVSQETRRFLLGCLWCSSIFEGHRAPDGYHLLRIMVGGAQNREGTALPHAELLRRVMKDLREVFGPVPSPEWVRIVPWSEAIPQYNLGHRHRVNALHHAEQQLPNFFLGGNSLRGVAINDCIADSYRLSELVLKSIDS